MSFISNLISKLKIKIDYTSIKLGVKKGMSIPTLPPKVEKFYSHPIMRIFRVIGGFCAVLVLTKNYTYLSYPFDFLCMYVAFLQMLFIVIISIIKSIYSIRKLIYNSKEFEVRNSPLNRFASQIGTLVYCWKYACSTASAGVGLIGSGAIIDQLLEEGGHSKIFLPYLASYLNKVMVNNNP